MAQVPQGPYRRGRRDGLRGAMPISPWWPPCSEWTQAERDAYLVGYRAGVAKRHSELVRPG
jgi:hypothetical protein